MKKILAHKWLYLSWLILVLMVIAFNKGGVRTTTLTRDTLQQLDQPFYIGLISSLGILIWCMAACIPLFSSFMLSKNEPNSIGSKFLKWIGILSIMLMLDDLIMLHEVIFPQYLHLPDIFFYAIYLGYLSLFALRFIGFIFKETNYKLMITAAVFLGASIAIDMNILPGGIDVEDSFKMFGIITYAYYCVITSTDLLRKKTTSA